MEEILYYKQYHENLIRGCISSGIFASCMFLMCVVSRFRWKEEDKDSVFEYDLTRFNTSHADFKRYGGSEGQNEVKESKASHTKSKDDVIVENEVSEIAPDSKMIDEEAKEVKGEEQFHDHIETETMETKDEDIENTNSNSTIEILDKNKDDKSEKSEATEKFDKNEVKDDAGDQKEETDKGSEIDQNTAIDDNTKVQDDEEDTVGKDIEAGKENKAFVPEE